MSRAFPIRAKPSRIPLAEAAGLAGPLRRMRAVRLALGLGLIGLAAAALLLARGLQTEQAGLLPPGTSGVIVLDLSSSITSRTYRQIQETLSQAAGSRQGYGLVLFSDVAYEALPAGTRAAELRPFVRYFTPARRRSRRAGSIPFSGLPFPVSPWTGTFSGGTKISAGLGLALQIVDREGVGRPSVLLLSDLADNDYDYPALGAVLHEYVKRRLPLRVVALSPSREDRAAFAELLRGGRASLTDAPPPGAARPLDVDAPRGGVPAELIAAAAFLLLLAAANELWCGRVVWRAP